jgi:quinol monooxygenase YgiN
MRTQLFIALLFLALNASGQNKMVTRIARITIDSTKVELYMNLLKEQMQTAVRVEPGVISYEVFADKTNSSKITIIERYANNDAYLSHREAPHFKKYKDAVTDIVKSLELSEVNAILSEKKQRSL